MGQGGAKHRTAQESFANSGRGGGVRARRRYTSDFELEAPALRAALASSSQPLLITDALDRICFVNAAAEQLLGATDAHLHHSDLQRHLFTLDGSPALPGGALERIAYGPCTLQFALADGRVVRGTLTPLNDRWGQAAHVAIGLDPIARANSQAALEVLGRLAGELAHDINNQLSAALNYVFILQRRLGRTTPWASHLDELQSAAWHASALAGGLRLIGRTRSAEPERVALGQTLEQLEPLLRHLARNARVQLQIEPNLPEVHAPLAYLEQVVALATVYALARTPADGSLKLTAHACQPAPGQAPITRLTCEPVNATAVTPAPSLASMSHTNGVLRRALKRCRGRLAHDARRIWIDFRSAETPESSLALGRAHPAPPLWHRASARSKRSAS